MLRRRVLVSRPILALLLFTLTFNGSLIAQNKPAQKEQPEARTNGVVHSVNGVQGDVTLTGGGGLVVSQQGNTITVAAPTTLGVGRSEPDPRFALDVGGTGVMRIGNSIYLDGVSNTMTTSTGTINFSTSNLSTTGVISGDGSGLTRVPFSALTSGSNSNQFAALNPANIFAGTFNGVFTGNLTGTASSALTANSATVANGLAAGTFGNLYHFTNPGNTYQGTFLGTFNGNAASATTATTANTANTATTANTALSLASGQHQGEYAFTSAANQFTGTFFGNLSGRASTADSASTASMATTAGIANDLAGGTFGNLYHFTNTGNTYQGTFLGNFNGKATTAGTADVAKTLLGGQHTNQYDFSHLANRFVGNFVGNLQGNAQTATTAQNAANATNAQNAVSAQNATTATTAQTATTLAAGQHNGAYNFTSQSNIYRGTFIGDGSQLTGVSTSGLAAGAYGNAYQFTNSGNQFSGAFTGNLNGNATTATTLAAGTHSAGYAFINEGNTFNGAFIGDGSLLTGVIAADDTRVSKSGDTMSGLLQLSAQGLQFADGTTMTTSATPQGWSLGGNAGLDGTSFLGTTDDNPLQFRVLGVNVFRIAPPQNGYSNGSEDSPILIAGGATNDIQGSSNGSAILSGGASDYPNYILGKFAVIAGGRSNLIGSNHSVVAGGGNNTAGFGSTYSYVSGEREYATVSGGSGNRANETLSVIAGGYNNQTNGVAANVGGGVENHANGDQSAIAGGANNMADGDLSFIAGGMNNYAYGNASIAAGVDALAIHNNSFVFNDGSSPPLQSDRDREFVVRATGGFRFLTNDNTTSGVRLNPGSGTWQSLSDRNAKKDLEAVDAETVLRAVSTMPIWRWSYKAEADGVRHMGPTAQDFRAAFGLGDSDTTISVVDADGVNLAALQALEKRTAKLQEENASLKREIETLRTMQQQMLQRMEEILRERR